MERVIELVKYIILSIVQGIGEVLPISSSGHLLLVRKIFKLGGEELSLEIFLHLASLLALFIYYRKIILELVKGFFLYVFKKDKESYRNFKFAIGLVISLIPTCLVGYFLDDYLDFFFRYSFIIGVFLILNGINLYMVRKKQGNKKIVEMPNCSFLKIGLGQCMGLIPGFSRSGACLSMCYREKMDMEDSERFTFLILFPLVLGSVFLNMGEFSFDKDRVVLLIISFIMTFMITFFSLGLLKKIVKENKLYYFTYYCLVMGILVMFIG